MWSLNRFSRRVKHIVGLNSLWEVVWNTDGLSWGLKDLDPIPILEEVLKSNGFSCGLKHLDLNPILEEVWNTNGLCWGLKKKKKNLLGLNPVWEEVWNSNWLSCGVEIVLDLNPTCGVLQFVIDERDGQLLNVEVMDKDPGNKDDKLGR